MSEETYNMSWGSYAQNATTLLANLINETDFTDVTLVCEGGKYIKAHKVILSGSSYFFNNFIRTITHQNPVVYLSGIAYEDLQAILELIYLGKTEVVQENLENFVKTAEKLKIIGLTEDVGVASKNSAKSLAPPPPPPTNEIEHKPPNVPTSSFQEKIPTVAGAFNGGKSKDVPVVPTNPKRSSRMGQQFQLPEQKPDLPLLSCEKCPYTSYDSERLGVHMLHYHPIQYTCNNCSYKTSTIESLKEHKARACNQGGQMKSENMYKNQDMVNSRRL